ncbi:MAG: hypothetical protein JXR84_04350 [Anaerolineae bacterium]|nr:hypothetical protein [Anaerolineae bacterium]
MVGFMDYVQLVSDMRNAQKDYFQQRTRSALSLAKELEQRVDRVTLQLIGEQAVQEALFETKQEGV